MRTTMTFDKIRNSMLLGVAGLGTAAGLAMGPATAAHATDIPAVPGSTTNTATQNSPAPADNSAATSNNAPAAPAAPSESMIASYNGALQPNGYYCGPAATRIALSAHGTPPTFDSLAQELGTTTSGTQSIDDVTRVLNDHRGAGTYVSTMIDGNTATADQTAKLRTDVMDSISHGDPVVANIAGAVVDNNGESHRYMGGHYLTITGYTDDGQTVRVTDPADTVGSNNYQLPIAKMANWIASRGYTS